MTVNEAVRALRNELGESQEKFASRLETSVRTIARYESNRMPRPDVLTQMRKLAAERNLAEIASALTSSLDQQDAEDEEAVAVSKAFGLTMKHRSAIPIMWQNVLSALEAAVIRMRTDCPQIPREVLDSTVIDIRLARDGQAMKKIRAAALALYEESDNLNYDAAFSKALLANPQLYQQYQAERAMAATDLDKIKPARTVK